MSSPERWQVRENSRFRSGRELPPVRPKGAADLWDFWNLMPGLCADIRFRNERVSHTPNVGHFAFDFFSFLGGLVGPEGLEPPTKAL